MRSRVLAGVLVLTAAVAAGCGSRATAPPAPAPSTPPSPAPSAPSSTHRHHGIRGTVTAEDGSTWTVTTAAQKTFTVTLTPQTVFGTKRAPASAQAFPVGAQVRVVGTVAGTAVAAERIATPRATGGRTSATTDPSAVPTR